MCCHASIASAVSTFSECPGCFVNFYNVISVEKQRHNKTKKKWRNCRRMLIEYQYTRLGLRHAAVATTASMMRAARGQRWQSRFLSREREREENWFIALGAHIIAYRMVRRCRDDSAKQHWLSQFHSIRASMSLCARLSFDLSEKGENAENTIFSYFTHCTNIPSAAINTLRSLSSTNAYMYWCVLCTTGNIDSICFLQQQQQQPIRQCQCCSNSTSTAWVDARTRKKNKNNPLPREAVINVIAVSSLRCILHLLPTLRQQRTRWLMVFTLLCVCLATSVEHKTWPQKINTSSAVTNKTLTRASGYPLAIWLSANVR